MTADHYHQVLIGLDRALLVFHEAAADLTPADVQLRTEIAVLRSQVLRAESGHPFPLNPSQSRPATDNDPEITRSPFSIPRHDFT